MQDECLKYSDQTIFLINADKLPKHAGFQTHLDTLPPSQIHDHASFLILRSGFCSIKIHAVFNTSAVDILKLKQKSTPMRDEECSVGYGSRIKLKNNAGLDFNETHLCFVCRSNFWLSSAHSVWTRTFHSSTVCKAVHWSCWKTRWVARYAAGLRPLNSYGSSSRCHLVSLGSHAIKTWLLLIG